MSQPYRVMEWRGKMRGFIDPPHANRTYVRSTGGIGDLIMSLGVAESLNEEVGDVTVYSKWPEIGAMFSTLPQLHENALMDGIGTRIGWDWYIVINTPAFFKFAGNFDGFRNLKMNDILLRHRQFVTSGDWERVIEDHPHLDNVAARMSIKLDLTRDEIAYKFLGLTKVKRKMPSETAIMLSKPSPVEGPYITIHDGFDANNAQVKSRAMKTWDLQHWKDFVSEFKRTHPGIKVVQLGGSTSRRVKGVDVDLVGSLTFEQSMRVLAASACHIDGDSGLVHAAYLFDVRSVVLFGPTPAQFFGYRENWNISSPHCGDCWWLNTDWMSRCQLDYATPECMDSISPELVLQGVRGVLGV